MSFTASCFLSQDLKGYTWPPVFVFSISALPIHTFFFSHSTFGGNQTSQMKTVPALGALVPSVVTVASPSVCHASCNLVVRSNRDASLIK